MNMASLVELKKNPKIPRLAPGDTVKVHTKIIEGEKERTQVFQGIVIKERRTKEGMAFTVRHVAYGVGVERTFPDTSPLVEKVEIMRHGKVRRAKLYYLRALSGKASRIKERRLEKELGAEARPAPAVTEAERAEVQQPGSEAPAPEQATAAKSVETAAAPAQPAAEKPAEAQPAEAQPPAEPPQASAKP